ncbi:MBL fold metallo-hydrolase [Dyadobacter sandarakinus]|uniref:MBL fold metallo-hydrolase n=1 Tax=Dyadobacter sandarakinus TaxID=2747268 RepID=A0ABX7I6P1_9BACT|nr:MBL fold metallo-hydrolase [Dyadobacter sandarakinus]QRR01610.1 MBL fold metallo-hydrolase [Dyadobacter sandarakinus]
MKIHQFEDQYLSHYSYAILSECESKVVLIDPARNPQPYYDFAAQNGAVIIAVIETHSHADFVSSHLEISQTTSSPIYASAHTGASYDHIPFDDGSSLSFGKIVLKPLNTPGHSEDSISIVLEHNGIAKAIFSGDTLFIGDCGRPDLRESDSDASSQRGKLATKMYDSLREKILTLDDAVVLYPAHGAGTLCGKALSDANSSTIGQEKLTNWSLQEMTKEDFIQRLTSDQPFIPVYFPFDVALNKKGAAHFKPGLEGVKRINLTTEPQNRLEDNILIIDTRDERIFKEGHLPNSVNMMDGKKFETWLGSIIKPEETFYLTGDSWQVLERLIERTASIGYEPAIKSAFVAGPAPLQTPLLDKVHFRQNQNKYSIIDVRNLSEAAEDKIFESSISIPLADIREKIGLVPLDKPIAVHCASGYRSAVGSSLIAALLNGQVQVFDIGDFVKEFSKQSIVS